MLNAKNAINKPVQHTKKVSEYGIIMVITSPKLRFLLYLRINAKITPAYVIIGVIIFVDESATRYAAETRSGVIAGFTAYNIGTKIGPSSIHFDVRPPTNKLISAVVKIKPIISRIGESCKPIADKPLAPK